MTLCATEFLRRFFLHVLPKGFVRIRHFGFLANRWRASRLALGRQLLASGSSTEQHIRAHGLPDSSSLWHCPRCGASMIVIQRFTAAELSACTYFDSSCCAHYQRFEDVLRHADASLCSPEVHDLSHYPLPTLLQFLATSHTVLIGLSGSYPPTCCTPNHRSNPIAPASAANTSGFLLVCSSKTPRIEFQFVVKVSCTRRFRSSVATTSLATIRE
jgi:Putative transposase